MSHSFYNKYSDYLKQKYGCKVYKLPVNLPITCPNRIHGDGCSFCAEIGTGFESLDNALTVKYQLEENKRYISSRYHAQKFIAYFQNYTNTYMPIEQFKMYVMQVCAVPDIVELSISTRPDCIREDYLEFLATFSIQTGIDVNIELGLQTVNYHTLKQIHRGHGLAEFIDAVLRIKKYPMSVCTHMILNLPGDTMVDVIEGAKLLSVLPVDIVKLHSLYIPKTSVMARQYLNHEFELCSKEEYLNRVKTFLEYLKPTMVVERLFSRIPEEDALFSNWETSWWKLQEELETLMGDIHYQGRLFDYTTGAAIDI